MRIHLTVCAIVLGAGDIEARVRVMRCLGWTRLLRLLINCIRVLACDISAHVKNPTWSTLIYNMDLMTLYTMWVLNGVDYVIFLRWTHVLLKIRSHRDTSSCHLHLYQARTLSRLYALLYIVFRNSNYCVIVIVCVITVYSMHTPCVGSTLAIFAVMWPVPHIWVGGWCEDGACCVLYHHSTTPLKSWCPMLRNERSGSMISWLTIISISVLPKKQCHIGVNIKKHVQNLCGDDLLSDRCGGHDNVYVFLSFQVRTHKGDGACVFNIYTFSSITCGTMAPHGYTLTW